MKICLSPIAIGIGGVIFIRGMPCIIWPKAFRLRPVAFSQDFIVSLDFFGLVYPEPVEGFFHLSSRNQKQYLDCYYTKQKGIDNEWITWKKIKVEH